MGRLLLGLGLGAFGALLVACGDDGAGTGGGAATAAGPATGAGPSSGTMSTSASTGSTGAGGSGGSSSFAGDIGPDAAACELVPPAGDPPCEATGSGQCFYISAESGDDDAGDGSFASPWRTLANVVSYYGTPGENGSTPAPDGAVDLEPGDVVYLRSGTYDDLHNYNGDTQVAFFRGVSGTTAEPISLFAYPGEAPVIDPGGDGPGLVILQSESWRVRGLEIRNAFWAGIWVAEAEDVVLSHLEVHDTDGVDNDNPAGIHVLSSSDIEIACSEVYDNYDRTAADTGGVGTENSANVVAFSGGNLRIHHNHVYNTPEPTADLTGGGIKYKHAASVVDAVFEVDHNIIRRSKFFAVGTGTQHSHVHRNLIADGEGIVSRDFGGPTHQTDQVFEYNTLYRADGLYLSPTADWNDANFQDPSGVVYRNNIVIHELDSPSQENGIVVIGTYGSDALYDATLPALTFAANCYQNPDGPLNFSFFAANGGNYGEMGDQYDLAGWQALGFDAGSLDVDPMFLDAAGGDFHLGDGSPCAGMGVFAE
jgi:hypothetical protein